MAYFKRCNINNYYGYRIDISGIGKKSIPLHLHLTEFTSLALPQ